MKHRQKLTIPFILLFLLSINTLGFAGLQDRAFGTHNIGQVGYFTTNIGQFYPYGGQFEKTLEYPINSGHIAIYRQCIMLGVPVNVISAADGRFEEFDAIGGYNAGNAEIAISDNPLTWPSYGWPVQDESGKPIIRSQQDSYCVYSDSTNWRYYNNNEEDMLLDVRVHQTIYSWGVKDADKFLVLKFEIENKSTRAYEEMYFNYYSDLDIGGIDNAAREWADDCVELDLSRDLAYFYDSDNYSDDWAEPNPFLSGVTFLKTPNDMGITDFHWIDVTIDEVAVNSAHWDSVSYYLMKSDTTYFHEHPDLNVNDYFHLGDNPIDGTHYDDPETSRITDAEGNLIGGPMVAYICNGPFNVQPGDTAEIIVAVMVGDTEDDLIAITDKIWGHYENDFNIATVPNPTISAQTSDRSVKLNWNNAIDIERPDLEGYIIYRTTDQTLKEWETIDTLALVYSDSVLKEDIYEYVDSRNVYNGFNYIYNVSAYRKTITGDIEESTRLADINNIGNQTNAVIIEPASRIAISQMDMDKIKVVPNPFIVSARWDEERLGNSAFGEPIRNLAFTNLPRPSTIKIFTLDGDLVQTLEHNAENGRAEWNLLSSENRPVVSGLYFFHVSSSIGEKIGRFAVIR